MEESFALGHRELFIQSKEVFDSFSQRKNTWKHVVLEFEDLLPFCFSAPVSLELKPSFGNKDPYAFSVYESCLMALLPSKHGSKFFILFPSSQNVYVREYLRRIGHKVETLPARILQTALEVCENTYFNTSWLTGLNAEIQKAIHSVFISDLSASELLERERINPSILKVSRRPKVITNTLVAKKWKDRLR